MYCLDSAIRQNKHTISVAAMENNLAADVHTNDLLRDSGAACAKQRGFQAQKGWCVVEGGNHGHGERKGCEAL